jgi:hypothetical protein
MNDGEGAMEEGGVSAETTIDALMDRVAAAIGEIEQAKQERSTEAVRSARTQLAAFHGVARLRRQAESQTKVA